MNTGNLPASAVEEGSSNRTIMSYMFGESDTHGEVHPRHLTNHGIELNDITFFWKEDKYF